MALEDEEKCEVCHREKDKYDPNTSLADAVFDGNLKKMCARCIKLHNAVLLSQPNVSKFEGIGRCSMKQRKEAFKKQMEFYDFGKMIKNARQKAGLTIENVSKELSLPEKIISDVEEGTLKDRILVDKVKQFLNFALRKKREQLQKQAEQMNIKENQEQKKGEQEKNEQINLQSKDLTIRDVRIIREKKKQEIRLNNEKENIERAEKDMSKEI